MVHQKLKLKKIKNVNKNTEEIYITIKVNKYDYMNIMKKINKIKLKTYVKKSFIPKFTKKYPR